MEQILFVSVQASEQTRCLRLHSNDYSVTSLSESGGHVVVGRRLVSSQPSLVTSHS